MSSERIRSFIRPLTPPHCSKAKSNLLILSSQSCNSAEDSATKQMNPSIQTEWSPQQDYEDASVRELAPGPRRVSFTARIVNMYEQTIESRRPRPAKGCFRLLVKDDSGLVLVKLWYAESAYTLHLGTLITIWTTHISSTSSISSSVSPTSAKAAPISTSIFPDRDTGCCVQIHSAETNDSTACRTPIAYRGGHALLGFVSLKTLTESGGDTVPDAKMLVCVEAIGPTETVTATNGDLTTTISIGVCDRSRHATLTLYRLLIPSAQMWKPQKTVVLLSSPKYYPSGRITATSASQIEVDPDICEAKALRNWVQREHSAINEPFPQHLFDMKAIGDSLIKLQHTLASLHSYIDAAPSQTYTGYISILLAELSVVHLYTRQQLFSMECCSMPVYSNDLLGICRQCGDCVELRINPDVVGELADETGSIHSNITSAKGTGSPASKFDTPYSSSHSKTMWSDDAWRRLFGRTPAELAAHCAAEGAFEFMQLMEQRISWMRVTLLVGWTGDYGGGRLAVLDVSQ